jgi:2-oxoglutarate ferredoxin oxidoreductase subunit beta
MYGLKEDWEKVESRPRCFVLDDYKGAVPRWCSGCGDHALLTSLQRLARDEQFPPEKTVFVSGIGCSSRLPHYMKTYGFHGLHGRPLPVASGIRARRPDLHIFVVTGDGDCCAIGTGHWIHAIRYNMKMTVLLLDNNIYGLTKMQSSPTTPRGASSLTHPEGVPLSPINPITVTLGITNASFVAQTVDWNPPHLFATLQAAHRHPGLAFVRIIQRCPHYMPTAWEGVQNDPSRVLMMIHESGVAVDEAVARLFSNRVEHDPSDLDDARRIAAREDVLPIGLFYRNESADRYDLNTVRRLGMSAEDKIKGLERELDRFLI